MVDETDSLLLVALRHRDSCAERYLVQRFSPMLLHYFACRGVDADDADDLVQTTFLHALRGLVKFRHQASLTTWISSIATNVARMHFRLVSQRERLVSRVGERAQPAVEPNVSDPYLRARIRTMLETLRPAERRALLMHVAGFTHGEIGISLSVAVGTSKALVHRARKRARRSLAKESCCLSTSDASSRTVSSASPVRLQAALTHHLPKHTTVA